MFLSLKQTGFISMLASTVLGLPIMEMEVLDFLNNILNVIVSIFSYFSEFHIALIFEKLMSSCLKLG